ncbi:Arm DNA-binding domain-containing protein, partial [bacterium]|nr:Arm DNA-binding domain-containing protein [bacterium]
MPRLVNGLTTRRVQTENNPGLYADGFGLYLQVTQSGSKTWIYRYSLRGRRRDMGLGSVKIISLKEARDRAYEARRKVQIDKVDPID